MGKKKIKALAKAARAITAKSGKAVRAGKSKEERRRHKLEQRKREKAKITPLQWTQPPPAHLVGKLNVPKVKSKYQSYFEFAENTEKKDKKLEFKVTKDPNPPPGFTFVPIGDPDLTNMCKELSRNREAMIFIVSNSDEGVSKVSEHMHRMGYHFREAIVDDARAIVGETVLVPIAPGQVEPIPESQEEINKQADAAIRDLFPRIPHMDRTMIVEHAFKKGALFHGEKTVGLQDNIPLSRRVQLAVLAHIRHTHTRYDQLLKEASWINARKVVEPVCLDILVKWRGDEETGRDQMDEILREVVIITDSEGEEEEEEEEDSSSEEDDSDEGEVTSESSPEVVAVPDPRTQQSQSAAQERHRPQMVDRIASRTRSKAVPSAKTSGRGLQRYRDALNQAQMRQGIPVRDNVRSDHVAKGRPSPRLASSQDIFPQSPPPGLHPPYRRREYNDVGPGRFDHISTRQPVLQHPQQRPVPPITIHRNEATLTSQAELPYRGNPPHQGSNLQHFREQRPSQVVRQSPKRHDLQDMLVPSIESPSRDAMISPSHLNEPYDIHSHSAQKSYSRVMVDGRRLSPPRRQVVVIDDDSNHVKRRRVVREHESGHHGPLPSRDYTVHAMSPLGNSHFTRPSYVEQKDFPVRRPAMNSDSREGLLEDARSSYHGTGAIPVYDAPDPGSLVRPPEHFRMDLVDIRHREEPRFVRQVGQPVPVREHVNEPVYRRPVNTVESGRDGQYMRSNEQIPGARYAEPDYRINMPRSTTFPVHNTVSRSDDMGPRPVPTEQDLSHEMSHSRLEDAVSRPRGTFAFSDRSPQAFDLNNFRGHLAYADRPLSRPQSRPRSPLHYVERPSYREEVRRPVVSEQNPPVYAEHYGTPGRPSNTAPLPQPRHTPPYNRAPPPRRQVIALD